MDVFSKLSKGLNFQQMFNNKTAPTSGALERTSGRNMEQDDFDYVQMIPYDSYDFQSAKQRASIKWILSKAYNNKIPEELSEPFYRDHEVSKFRPHVVQGLSTAELYCLALCNLYADPNYSQLSPWGIVQALARKGVYVQAPTDVQLTETVLMRVPINASAHMAVIEGMMVLQVKEIITNERILSTVHRFGPTVHPREIPATEESLLLWINRAVLAIKDYIQNNNAHEHGLSSTQVEGWTQMPLFQDLSDLSDGVGLTALLAFYCQDELALSEIAVPTPGEPLSVSDSIWNLQLLQRICRDSLPYNVCHFTYEDILYLHESMKQNMLSFLADLFNQLELHPAPNVKLLGSNNVIPLRPGLTSEGVTIRRGFALQQSQITIPDLRPTLYMNPPSSSSSSSTERNTSKSQSATSTPKRQNSMQNRKSSLNVFDTSSPPIQSSASVVSVPVRRSGTPLDYSEKAHSDRSNNKEQRYYANSSEDSEEFVVHRGRNVPTLAQVIRSVSPSSQEERSSPASRMSMSRNTSALNRDEDDESVPAAGRPSNWSANKTSYAGRRSRRNSFSEADSQLTVENFGGSQDNLNRFVIGKNPDKQPAVVNDSTASPVRYPRRQTSQEPADYYDSPPPAPSQQQQLPPQQQQQQQSGTPSRQQNLNYSSSSQGVDDGAEAVFYGKKKFNYSLENRDDNYGQQKTFDNRNQQEYGQYSGNFNQPQPQFQIQSQPGYSYDRQQSTNPDANVTVFVVNDKDLGGFGEPPLRSTSMTNLSRLSDLPNKPVNIVYLPNNNGYGDRNTRGPPPSSAQDRTGDYHTMPNSVRGSYGPPNNSYMTINQTTPTSRKSGDDFDEDFDTEDIASQLASIRLKLEEKRKRIEMEKGRMESIASKQQFKLGKAAYLKAINKGKSDASVGSSSTSSSLGNPTSHRNLPEVDLTDKKVGNVSSKKKQLSLKDLESKWLNKTDEPCRTPEIENMDEYTYQKSLAKMDTSLSELETDIHRLATQQQQIQQQHNQQQQFFLHGDTSTDSAGGSGSDTGKRKTWAVPSSANSTVVSGGVNNVNGGSSTVRNQWGVPKPFSGSVETSEPSVIKYNGEVRTGNSPYGPTVTSSTTTTTKPVPPAKPSVVSDVNSTANTTGGSGSVSTNSNSSFRLHSQGARLFNRPSEESDKTDQRPTPPPRRNNSNSTVYHAAPVPGPDDMEPQSVSFVQDDRSSSELASLNSSKKSLQITSGSKTYRITPETGSPPRRSAHRLFNNDGPDASLTSSDENPSLNERGFYIQIDNDGPKRPKPPLRTKSPAKRKEGGGTNPYESSNSASKRDIASEYIQSIVDRVPISALQDDEEEDFRVYHHDRDLYSERRNSMDKLGGELVIDERPNLNSSELDLMEKKKERILLQSLKRQQQQEELRRIKEMEIQRKKDEEAAKADEKMRKREEEKARKQAILESYRMKKLEESEKDGKGWEVQESTTKRFMRPKSSNLGAGPRPRPKTIHLSEVDSGANSYSYKPGVLRRSDSQNSSTSLARSQGKRGSNNTLYSAGGGRQSRVTDPWGSTSSLNQDTRRRAVNSSYRPRRDLSTSRFEARSRRDSYLGSQDSLAHRANSASSLMDGTETEVTSSHRDSDSGVGTCSPPQRRTPSPHHPTHLGTVPSQTSCSLPSPSGPGSLPPGLISRRRGFDDGSSDISSVASSNMDYSGLRLYKQPTAKSNRSIILNAVEYCVFPGVVNRDQKLRVLEEVNRSESKHFLIMFRDAGCQFRALYSYSPERNDEIVLLHGRGPKQVNDRMFEKFFKYNSGGKCFTQVHTKHLTVTIDAFTIHNALWQGKKPPQTKTRDMALVI